MANVPLTTSRTPFHLSLHYYFPFLCPEIYLNGIWRGVVFVVLFNVCYKTKRYNYCVLDKVMAIVRQMRVVTPRCPCGSMHLHAPLFYLSIPSCSRAWEFLNLNWSTQCLLCQGSRGSSSFWEQHSHSISLLNHVIVTQYGIPLSAMLPAYMFCGAITNRLKEPTCNWPPWTLGGEDGTLRTMVTWLHMI